MELILQLLPHGKQTRIKRIQGGYVGEQPSTFVANVGGIDIEIVRELMLDCPGNVGVAKNLNHWGDNELCRRGSDGQITLGLLPLHPMNKLRV